MVASASISPGSALTIEERPGNLIAVCFTAMASPCEVLLEQTDRALAMELGALVAREAWRVEQKYSRYRDHSVVAWILRNRGIDIEVDEETASLIDFARQCFEFHYL